MKILMGYSVFDGTPVYFNERRAFGVFIIGAITRYGKSALSKILFTGISKVRPTIIFDYKGEHAGMKYINFMSGDNIDVVENLVTVENFGFKISDFANLEDWMSLGFPLGASMEMMRLAPMIRVHKNDPKVFMDILEEIPLSGGDIDSFNSKYARLGLTYNHRFMEASLMSMIQKFQYLLTSNFFITEDEIRSGERIYIDDFGKYLYKHRHLHINLNLTDLEVAKGMAYVGKILGQVQPYIELLKPAILVEEADKMFPNVPAEAGIKPSSLKWAIEYAIKFQKYGVELFFIVQDLSLLFSTIVENNHGLILGHLPNTAVISSDKRDILNGLFWDYDANRRQFAYFRRGSGRYEVFEPVDCPVMMY